MGLGSHNWHIDGLCNVTWHDNKKWIEYELVAIIWCERKHNILKSISFEDYVESTTQIENHDFHYNLWNDLIKYL